MVRFWHKIPQNPLKGKKPMDLNPPEPSPATLDCISLMSLAHQGGAAEALAFMALYAKRNGARMSRLSLSPRGPGTVAVMFDLDIKNPPPGGVLEVG